MKRFILTILMLCIFVHPCFAGVSAKNEVKKGNLLYNKGEFGDALKQYQDALLDEPDSDIVNFNMGAALYKTGDYRNAIGHFEKSLVSEDQSLEQMASYNIGNAKYKYGIGKEETDLQGAVNLLRQSLHHYERALELEPEDEDAKFNYEFVKKELERLEEKLEQEEQEQSQSQEEDEQGEDAESEAQQQQAQEQEAQEEQTGAEKKEDYKKEQAEGIEPQGQAEDEEEQLSQQNAEVQKPIEEMSEKEALMLLENYRHEEEPRGLYKEKIQTRGLPEVVKDW